MGMQHQNNVMATQVQLHNTENPQVIRLCLLLKTSVFVGAQRLHSDIKSTSMTPSTELAGQVSHSGLGM